jgi:murein DD-endopeptidase MepM/ murein hydrolase activator NlpD
VAAVIAVARAAGGRAREAMRAAMVGALRAYAHLLFSRSLAVGALVLLATATDPGALALGLLGLVAARATTGALGLEAGAIAEGCYGYNALLVALGVAHVFGADPASAALAIAASGASVLVTASLSTLSTKLGGAPVLSLPFVLTSWLVTAAGPSLGMPAIDSVQDPSISGTPLDVLGALVFQPNGVAGALILAALLLHSRIAALLAGVGIAIASLFALAAPPEALAPLETGMALNAFLAATVVGGVWFVPSRASFALGAIAAVVATLATAAVARPLAVLGLAPLILPFNASALVVLFATRQRARDASPKSVDFAPGSPEENLAYVQTRLARFRALYAVDFRLPFRGAWTCTQGVDGAHTHKGAWRHGFDFEVTVEGRPFRGDGGSVEDHLCYRLPVLAAADGTVVHVEDGVPDARIGGMDLDRNWGNVVVVCHAPGLHSLVAHLAAGSVRVKPGHVVRRGDVLGACGSSGRSPRPHLHFQLQAEARVGAPTLPCRFGDAVDESTGAGPTLRLGVTPREGDVLRNVDVDDDLAAFFDFAPAAVATFRVGRTVERLEASVDLYGRRVLRSLDRDAVLYFARDDRGFTVLDALGRRSALHAVRAALGRVPFDGAVGLTWIDYLPARSSGARLLRPLRDLVAPFFDESGLEMIYEARRDGDVLEITGRSRRARRGAPLVTTRARLERGRGLVAVEVREGSREVRVDRVADDTASTAPPRTARDERPSSIPPLSLAEPLRSQPGES